MQPHPSVNNNNDALDDDEDWIIIGDDSSSKGRKGKPQLIKDFSNTTTSSISQPIPVQKEMLNIYSTSSSDGDFAGQLPELYFSTVPKSVPSDFYASSSSGRDSDPPKHFLCPISCEVMQKPVIASDGHTYELCYIEKWLNDHIRSPMTGEEMPHKMLIANFNLKSQIDEWRSRCISDYEFELL